MASPELLQRFTKTRQYGEKTPEDRAFFLKKFKELSPEDQQAVIDESESAPESATGMPEVNPATSPANLNADIRSALLGGRPEPQAKDLAGIGLGAGLQIGVGMLADRYLPGSSLLLRAGVDAVGNLASRKVPQALGLAPGDPMEFGLQEVADVAIPGALRGVEKLTRLGHGPAREAVGKAKAKNAEQDQELLADTVDWQGKVSAAEDKVAAAEKRVVDTAGTANDKATAEYRQALSQRDALIAQQQAAANTAMAKAQREAADLTRAQRDEVIRFNAEAKVAYQDRIAKISQDTSLSQEKKVLAFQRELDEYQASVRQHAESAQGLRGVPASLPLEDYESMYAALPQTDRVAISNARKAASFVISEIDQHFPGFKDTALYRKAQGISKYGETAEAAAVSPILDPATLKPVSKQVEAQSADPTFKEVRELLKDVGALKGQSEAADSRMLGLVKTLYKGVRADIAATGEAGSALAAANRAFSRSETVSDIAEIINQGISPRRGGQEIEVSAKSIFKKIENFLETDRFAKTALDPKELAEIRATVNRLTDIKALKQQPKPKPYVRPDYRRVAPPVELPEPPVVEPDYSRISSKVVPPVGPPPVPVLPEAADVGPMTVPVRPQPMPEVQPELGKFPTGQAILGKVLGAGASGFLAEQFLPPKYKGMAIAAGITVGVGAAVGPHVVSKMLLSGPRGRKILENFMESRPNLTSADFAMLAQIGKAIGVVPSNLTEPRQEAPSE